MPIATPNKLRTSFPAMNTNRQEPASVIAETTLLAVIYGVLFAAYLVLGAVIH